MKTIKGEEIIRLWKRAEELSHTIPSNKMYSGDYINKTNEFKATNSIFGCCYFKPCGYNVSFRMTNYDAKGWNIHEYVGLYGRATQIRYIKPNEEYKIDL